MMYNEGSARRTLMIHWVTVTVLVTILLSVKSYSQKPSEKPLVTSGVKKHNGVSINQLTDSIINVNKREALDSGNDSLYIALTFQQFDKRNINSVDVFGIVLLNDLIINKIDISDKYLDVLLRAYLSLGNYFMNQENSFASDTGLVKHYFENIHQFFV